MNAIGRVLSTLVRGLARRPGYALTVIVTLAVGIGASTSIFSILEGTVLRPLPYPEPDALIRIRDRYVPTGGAGGMSIPNYLDLAAQNESLAEFTAYRAGSVNLAAEDAPVRARSLVVTANFFDALEVRPVRGRGFEPGEDREGAARVAVLSDRLWRERYGAGADALGQTVLVNAEPHTIVGVLPPSFWFPGDAQIVVPFAWDENDVAAGRGNRRIEGFARLNPGFTETSARAELEALFAGIAEAHPGTGSDGWTVQTFNVRDWMLGYNRTSLWLLSGAVLLVLLIACVNVVNLMLVRAERRQREIAVRAAMGAGRARLARGFLAESVLLAAVASGLGVALAWGATRVLVGLFGGQLPRADQVGLGVPVVLFAVGLALLTGFLVGLAPALRLDQARIYQVLRESGHGVAGTGSRLQRGLVAGEVALAVLLVAGAGLLMNSFWRMNRIDSGVEAEGAVAFSVELPYAVYESLESRELFFRQAVERIRGLAGVQHVGITDRIPTMGGYNITTLASPDDPELEASFVEIRRVTPGFFPAAGIPLLAGRMLTANDARNRAQVVLISDALAQQIFPNGDAIGKRINPGWTEEGFEVVGIVGSVREFGILRDKRPAFYWPYPVPNAPRAMVFLVRTERGDPLALLPAIRATLAELDPNLPVYGVRTLEDGKLAWTGNRWLATALFGAFGALALALSALGIFGVLAFAVEQRTREMGIRIALGASSNSVVSMVVSQGLRLVALGLVIGVVAAVFASRLLGNLLYEVEPADPATLAAVAVTALAAAVAAAYLPARRAARVEPMRVLREE